MRNDDSPAGGRDDRDRLRDWFNERIREPFWQKVAIGVGILLLLKLPFVSGIVSHAERALLDWQIAAIQGTSGGDGIAFIDVDDDTEALLSNAGVAPYFTPRDKLLTLIKAAVAAQAGIVLVDFDLSQPTDQDAFSAPASPLRPWAGQHFSTPIAILPTTLAHTLARATPPTARAFRSFSCARCGSRRGAPRRRRRCAFPSRRFSTRRWCGRRASCGPRRCSIAMTTISCAAGACGSRPAHRGAIPSCCRRPR
jgi:hypothetical protein